MPSTYIPTGVDHSASINLATLDEAKALARRLRRERAATGETLSHSQSLELAARKLGHPIWNTAAARLLPRRPFRPNVGDRIRGIYLKQDFVGEVLAVSALAGGSQHRIAVELDEVIDVVTFDSFSAFRKRLNATLDERGRTAAKTRDGEPHMIVFETISSVV